MASSLAVGFVFSAILSSFSCFCPDYILRSFQSLYLLVVVCFSIACGLEKVYKHISVLEHTAPSPTTGHLRLCCDKKGLLYSVC